MSQKNWVNVWSYYSSNVFHYGKYDLDYTSDIILLDLILKLKSSIFSILYIIFS